MKPDQFAELAIGQLAPATQSRAGDDIRAVLDEDLQITVRELPEGGPHRDGHGSCDGMSFLTDQATILFRPTPGKRENFTLAHELGHILVRDCDPIQDWLADHPQPEAAEEWLCDRIAQRLLLPPKLITGLPSPITASDVIALSQGSQASLAACVVAASGRLTGPAGIILVDVATGIVTLSSVQPDSAYGWPANFPSRGQSLPEGHPLQQLRLTTVGAKRGRMTWTTPWQQTSDYYVDAGRHRGQLVAVFADRDLWNSETLHLDPPREFLRPRLGTVTCCGRTHQVSTFACTDCGNHYCPTCHRCTCDRRAATEVTCTQCFQRKQAHLIADGICVDCR